MHLPLRNATAAFAALTFSLSASAQSASQTPSQTSTPTRLPVQGSDWRSAQALAANSRIRIISDKKTAECAVVSVDEQQLTCSHGHAQYVFPRGEVRKIKLSQEARSTGGMAAIGVAVGAGAGAGIGVAVNSGDKSSYAHVSSAKSAGVGAALGGIILGGIGAGVGYAKDTFAGPVIYSR